MGLLDQLEDLIGQHAAGAVPQQQALDHHDELASAATPEQHLAATQEAVQGMSPSEQEALAQHVQTHAQQHGIDLGSLLGGGGAAALAGGGSGSALGALGGAGGLAQVLSQLGRQGGGLGALLGGAGGAGGAVGGSLLSGMVGALAKQMLSRR